MHPIQTLLKSLSPHSHPSDTASLPLFELLESACEGTVVVDQNSHIVWISDKYKALLKLQDKTEIIGHDIQQIIPNSTMRQVVESGHPQLLDLMRFGERWFVVTRLPLKDDNGKVAGAIGFVFYDELDYLRPLVDKFTRLKVQRPTTDKSRSTRYSFEDMIGQSPVVLLLRQQALRASQLDSTVLLLGETGTGKELVAQAIHNASPRASASFVGVNTAALPETLVEAELFGAAPGAYTGADKKGRKGKFELAHGGTLFLDEIGEMPASVQAKLLRVLQEREVEPLGSNTVVKVDVRVIAATSRNLEKLVADGLFRADLYYRLNVLPLTLPPLRERIEDLPILCKKLNQSISEELGEPEVAINDALLEKLSSYHWPGNIRELRNVLERLNLFADQGEVSIDILGGLVPVSRDIGTNTDVKILPLSETIAAAEKHAIDQALVATNNNRTRAARLLGISRANLYEKLNKQNVG
ncbi:MAG: sigma 54-interacting transcriptional regulator [Motiliproteus sp.]